MSGQLNHSPATIIQKLLIEFGHGSDAEDNIAWPVYRHVLPDDPNNAIVVVDREGITHGRSHIDGETFEHHGLQFLIRSSETGDGYQKARDILNWADRTVYRDFVTLDESVYLVQCITRKTDVLHLGQDDGATRRWKYSINAIVALNLDHELGTGT